MTGQCPYEGLETLWKEAASVGLSWQVGKVWAAIDKLRADTRTAAEWHAAMAAELVPVVMAWDPLKRVEECSE